MARMGDWRDNKDVEIPLDGIGGVNIVVKADVHRAGTSTRNSTNRAAKLTLTLHRHQLSLLRLREPGRDRGLRQDGQARQLRGLRLAQLRRLAHRHGREGGQCVKRAPKLILICALRLCVFFFSHRSLLSSLSFSLLWFFQSL